jgi:glycosyltransferase involved in cell wall biosynthesis
MSLDDVEKKHIFFLGASWFLVNPGGLERYVFELNKYLKTVNDHIEVWAFDIPDNGNSPSTKLINLGRSKSLLWKRLLTVYRKISQRKFTKLDAINFHFALYSLPLLPYLPRNTPLTFTFHGPWALESTEENINSLNIVLKRMIEQTVYRQCDRFIVLSKAFGTVLHETYHIPWSNIHIIPGGVDTLRFQLNLARQNARTQLNWPQDRPVLFTPRRLVHRMGLDKLIAALVQVTQDVPEVWLAIAGKGPLRETLEQQVRDLNLEENVKFLGFLPDEDLPVAYQAADLTVMPSQSLEGFGLVLLESLACGTPALCTPVGGMPEVVEPFYPSLVTESADENAIAERLIDFLIGRLELPSREACREYAVNNFDWKAIAPRIREVLLAPKES